MVQYEDECVGCPKEHGCMGSACPNRNVPHLYCDACGEEVDEFYEDELCINCVETSGEEV
jgi:hypothetical protein